MSVSTGAVCSIPEDFKHAPLQPRQIRLLKLLPSESTSDMISCLCIHSVLDESISPYVTISYAWGDPTPRHFIKINGKHLGITENAHCLLRSRRILLDSQPLWIDAICIDQGNQEERNEQVKLMGEIYSKATIVKIWLGEASDDSKLAFDFAREFEVIAPNLRLGSDVLDSVPKEHFKDLINLVCRPWFERVWVIQEALLPPRAELVCGEDVLDWDKFAKIPEELSNSKLLSSFMIGLSPGRMKESSKIPAGLEQVMMMQTLKLHLDDGKKLPMEGLLLTLGRCKATDARDKVFGLLGIAGDIEHPVFEVNYQKTAKELYRDVTRHLIQQNKRLWVCKYAGIGWERDLAGLPSWTPDYSKEPEKAMLFLPYAASGSKEPNSLDTEISDDLLTCGVLVDTIRQLGPVHNANPNPRFGEDHMEDLEGFTRYFEWYLKTKSMFLESEAQVEEFWRTLIANNSRPNEPSGPAEASFVESYRSFDIYYQGVEDGTEGEASDLVIWDAVNFKEALITPSAGRRFCKTHENRFGLVPPRAITGDLICILYGADVPFVLRAVTTHQDDQPKYILVGECYIHSLMDGEGLELGLAEQRFVLV
jgi:hypothetical protein